jgi:hypothetical protein
VNPNDPAQWSAFESFLARINVPEAVRWNGPPAVPTPEPSALGIALLAATILLGRPTEPTH